METGNFSITATKKEDGSISINKSVDGIEPLEYMLIASNIINVLSHEMQLIVSANITDKENKSNLVLPK